MAENLEKIRPVLTALEIGDTVSFPISRLKKCPHAGIRVRRNIQSPIQDKD